MKWNGALLKSQMGNSDHLEEVKRDIAQCATII